MSSRPSTPERELGSRLRAFREGKRIFRTAFAVDVGIGSDRLATYESGRVPLPFGIFLRINEKYFVSPRWLVTGKGKQADDRPFTALIDVPEINPRDALTTVWHRNLEPLLRQRFGSLDQELAFLLDWQEQVKLMQLRFSEPEFFRNLPPDAYATLNAAREDVVKSLRAVYKAGAKLVQLSHYRSRC